MLHVNIATY
jgi:hypothetical protein